MSRPDITIFIPTYHRPSTLKKAIESALAQTWKNFKILVSDNGADEETPAMVQQIAMKDARVHYIRHPQNRGMLGNYQFGLSVIDTPYFSFLSDDDFLFPCFCEITMKGFSEHPEAIFSAGATVSLSSDKRIIDVTLSGWPREGRYDPPHGLVAMCHQIPPPNTILFRREAIAEARLDPENSGCWDVEFMMQLAAKFPFVISKTPCGAFVNHLESFSNNASIADSLEITQKLILKMKAFPCLDTQIKSKVEKLLQLSIYKYTFNSILTDYRAQRTTRAKKSAREILPFFPIGFHTLPYAFSVLVCLVIPYSHRLFLFLKKLKNGFQRNKIIALDIPQLL